MDIKIIYSEYCDHCHELIHKLKEQGGISGLEIEYVEISTPEGFALAQKHNLDTVPAAVSSNGLCEITYIDGRVETVCP